VTRTVLEPKYEQVGAVVKLLNCIREVPVWNFSGLLVIITLFLF
jgi:hypothetical protein